MSTPQPTLSQSVVRLLRDLNLTHARIGQITGIKASEMTRLARGEREFKASHLVAIEKWMGVPLCAILAKSMQFIDCRNEAGDALLQYVEALTREAERAIEIRRRELAAGDSGEPRTKVA